MNELDRVLEMPTELDAFSMLLHRGEAHPRTRSGLMSVEVLQSTPDWDRFRAAFDNASRQVPRMRQKVVVPTLPTTAPRWVCDADFSLDYHVRRARVTAPGTLRDVLDAAELIMQSPMDTCRPLWSVTLVDGLADGQAAVLLHMSHAVTDGLGGVEMFLRVYDFEPDPPPRPVPALPVPSDLSPNDLMREGVGRLPSRIVRGARRAVSGGAQTLARVATKPGATVIGTLGYARSAARMMKPAAEPSPLLRRRSLATRSQAVNIRFTDLHRAAKAADGSLNDAYLAGLCGGLRLYHDAMDMPIQTLPMAVPVSLRSESDAAGGNHFTGVHLAAPIAEPDPALRISNIHEQMVKRREESALDIASAVAPVVNLLPANVFDAIGDMYTPADVQASNVPVYPEDTYLAGVKVLRQYGIGPLPGIAIMAVMVSRSGVCTITARYDRASITNEVLFARCLRDGFDEVLALSGDPDARAVPAAAITADPAPTLKPEPASKERRR